MQPSEVNMARAAEVRASDRVNRLTLLPASRGISQGRKKWVAVRLQFGTRERAYLGGGDSRIKMDGHLGYRYQPGQKCAREAEGGPGPMNGNRDR